MYLLPKFQDYPPGGIQYHTVSTVFPDHSWLHLQSNFTRATQLKKKGTNSLDLSQALNFLILGFEDIRIFLSGAHFFFQGRKKNTKRQTSGVFQQPTIFKAPVVSPTAWPFIFLLCSNALRKTLSFSNCKRRFFTSLGIGIRVWRSGGLSSGYPPWN